MTADPFRRLALFAAACLIFGALATVAVFVSWIIAAVAVAGGLLGVAVVTLERAPETAGDAHADAHNRAVLATGRSRMEIVRDAREAREPEVFDGS